MRDETIPSGREDREEALQLLRRAVRDCANRDVLRNLLSDIELGGTLDDEEIVSRIASRIGRGELRLLRRDRPTGPGGVAETSDPKADSAARSADRAWIRIQVVDEETADPIPNVMLQICLPDGARRPVSTDSRGEVDLTGIAPGTCEISCDVRGGRLTDTFHFAGTGVRAAELPPRPAPGGPIRIARIEAHRVRSGESLAGLAESVGMTWKELARFNWGTDTPTKINRFLRNVVGCTRKVDEHNYRFDDEDDPGIVYLPRPWSLSGLATDRSHVVRLRRREWAPRNSTPTWSSSAAMGPPASPTAATSSGASRSWTA